MDWLRAWHALTRPDSKASIRKLADRRATFGRPRPSPNKCRPYPHDLRSPANARNHWTTHDVGATLRAQRGDCAVRQRIRITADAFIVGWHPPSHCPRSLSGYRRQSAVFWRPIGQNAAVPRGNAAPWHRCMYPRDPIRRANGGTNLKAAARHMHPSRRFHLPAPCGASLERPQEPAKVVPLEDSTYRPPWDAAEYPLPADVKTSFVVRCLVRTNSDHVRMACEVRPAREVNGLASSNNSQRATR